MSFFNKSENEKDIYCLVERPECGSLEKEWFTRVFHELDAYIPFCECIGEETLVEVIMVPKNIELKVHIRKYKEDVDTGEIFPTSEGVSFSSAAFDFLQNNMKNFHFSSEKDTFVAHNELLVAFVDDRSCLLQQLIKTDEIEYSLKPNSLQLTKEQFKNLEKICSNVNDVLITTILTKVIPIEVMTHLNDCRHSHISLNKAKEFFISCFARELQQSVVREFHCTSCVQGVSTVSPHICLQLNLRQKFDFCSDSALLKFNIQKFLLYLSEKCSCEYTHSFFASMNLDMYLDFLVNVFAM